MELAEREIKSIASFKLQDEGIEIVIAGLTKEQRDYLLMLAMGCSNVDARRLSNVSEAQVRSWRRSELFCQKENSIEASEGEWKRDSLSIYLDTKLPFVVGELLTICMSGNNGGKPHKDKEKAIEFYLKELCGVSRAIAKSTNFEHFIIEMRREENAINENRS